MKPETFPVSVKRGNVELFIHKVRKTKKLKDGEIGAYDEFRFNYYEAGIRKMKASSDLAKAKRKATFIASKLSSGEGNLLKLSIEDGQAYLQLKQAEKRIGVPLPVAMAEYEAARRIARDAPLTDVARSYEKQQRTIVAQKTVSQVKDELVASKQKDKLSDSYVEDLESRCGKFAEMFQMPIYEVSATDIKSFLSGLNLSGRSQNNYRTAINTLFEFARAHGYVPNDHNVMERVSKAGIARNNIVDVDETCIFTPEDFSKLLQIAPESVLPVYTIGGFAGLRQSEIMRLNWEDIKLDRGFISVWGNVARKKRETRRPPILPNLASWLKPYNERSGKVWNASKPYFYELNAQLCEKAGITWKDNGLRHSFISYHIAQTRDVPAAAHTAGTSVAKIRSNYLELKTREEAERWFSLAR